MAVEFVEIASEIGIALRPMLSHDFDIHVSICNWAFQWFYSMEPYQELFSVSEGSRSQVMVQILDSKMATNGTKIKFNSNNLVKCLNFLNFWIFWKYFEQLSRVDLLKRALKWDSSLLCKSIIPKYRSGCISFLISMNDDDNGKRKCPNLED